jgi:hypothetical protein
MAKARHGFSERKVSVVIDVQLRSQTMQLSVGLCGCIEYNNSN